MVYKHRAQIENSLMIVGHTMNAGKRQCIVNLLKCITSQTANNCQSLPDMIVGCYAVIECQS